MIERRGSRIAASAAFAISCASVTTRGVAWTLPLVSAVPDGLRASLRISSWIGWSVPSGALMVCFFNSRRYFANSWCEGWDVDWGGEGWGWGWGGVEGDGMGWGEMG